MYGGSLPAGGLPGDHRGDAGNKLNHGTTEGDVALMVVQPLHDMNDADFAIVQGEFVQQQPQPQSPGQWQKTSGEQIQLFETL